MKKAIVLAAIFLISAQMMQAQILKEKDVPLAVKEACMKNFPGATEVKWMQEKKVSYTLMVKGKELYFDDKGTLMTKEKY